MNNYACPNCQSPYPKSKLFFLTKTNPIQRKNCKEYGLPHFSSSYKWFPLISGLLVTIPLNIVRYLTNSWTLALITAVAFSLVTLLWFVYSIYKTVKFEIVKWD